MRRGFKNDWLFPNKMAPQLQLPSIKVLLHGLEYSLTRTASISEYERALLLGEPLNDPNIVFIVDGRFFSSWHKDLHPDDPRQLEPDLWDYTSGIYRILQRALVTPSVFITQPGYDLLFRNDEQRLSDLVSQIYSIDDAGHAMDGKLSAIQTKLREVYSSHLRLKGLKDSIILQIPDEFQEGANLLAGFVREVDSQEEHYKKSDHRFSSPDDNGISIASSALYLACIGDKTCNIISSDPYIKKLVQRSVSLLTAQGIIPVDSLITQRLETNTISLLSNLHKEEQHQAQLIPELRVTSTTLNVSGKQPYNPKLSEQKALQLKETITTNHEFLLSLVRNYDQRFRGKPRFVFFKAAKEQISETFEIPPRSPPEHPNHPNEPSSPGSPGDSPGEKSPSHTSAQPPETSRGKGLPVQGGIPATRSGAPIGSGSGSPLSSSLLEARRNLGTIYKGFHSQVAQQAAQPLKPLHELQELEANIQLHLPIAQSLLSEDLERVIKGDLAELGKQIIAASIQPALLGLSTSVHEILENLSLLNSPPHYQTLLHGLEELNRLLGSYTPSPSPAPSPCLGAKQQPGAAEDYHGSQTAGSKTPESGHGRKPRRIPGSTPPTGFNPQNYLNKNVYLTDIAREAGVHHIGLYKKLEGIGVIFSKVKGKGSQFTMTDDVASLLQRSYEPKKVTLKGKEAKKGKGEKTK